MTSHWVTRLGVVAIVAGLGWWLIDERFGDGPRFGAPEEEAQRTPDFFAERFELDVSGDDGLPRYRLHGSSLEHFVGEDIWLIDAPWLIIFSDTGAPWHLRAPSGRAWNGGQEAALDGAVTLRRAASPSNRVFDADTSDVYLQPALRYVETDARATFRDEQSTMTGIGARAYLDRDILQLLSETRGVHEAESTP
jgi:lipopolysaccharide export system protein LptC